ncbi:MAG: YbaN family protein [Planctomycetota bacterium]|jgi:uncharacterized membrane protein YbaN (DUF454 family)
MPAISRPFLAALGLLWTLIALVGVALPLLPTTPFLLLAAFCFSRSSPRLHRWLLESPVLGPLIDDWERHRAIRRRAKWISSVLLIAFVSYPLGSGRVPGWAVPLVLATCAGVLGFIWTRPDHPVHDAPGSSGSADPDQDAER